MLVDKVGIDEGDVKRLRTLRGRRRDVSLLAGDDDAGLIWFLKIDGRNGMVLEVVLQGVVTVPGSEWRVRDRWPLAIN